MLTKYYVGVECTEFKKTSCAILVFFIYFEAIDYVLTSSIHFRTIQVKVVMCY